MTLTSKLGTAPGLTVIYAMIVGALIVALAMFMLAPIANEKKVCDQAVSTLFTTTDALELQRSMFLIRRLDCKVSTRL